MRPGRPAGGRMDETVDPPTADPVGSDHRRVLTVFDDNGSFLLAMFEFFIFFAWFMCLWWILGDLFRDRNLGGGAKTLWSLFIIFLPFLGVLVYLIARGSGMSDRAIEAQQDLRQRQDAYI